MRITINAGTTFLMSDKLGNVPEGTEMGLYHEDTRFLSRYEVTLDGQSPVPLSAQETDPYGAKFFQTNRALASVPRSQLGIIRRRMVGTGLHEAIEITNYGDDTATFTLGLLVDADFAHLLEVKRKVEVKGAHTYRKGSFRLVVGEEGYSLHLRYKQGSLLRRLVVHLSQRPTTGSGGRFRYALSLAPRASWQLHLDFRPFDEAVSVDSTAALQANMRGIEQYEQHEREHSALVRQAPRLETDAYVLQRAYEKSVDDFAALRITNETIGEHEFAVAAGIPWFMTLFGRDSLIAAYQALPFHPEAARGTLRALARLQGSQFDPLREEEPGKILHEHRYETFTGTQKGVPRFPYYGTIDATPLFLMLLAASYKATGDLIFIRELREAALRALEWMECYGDRDGDGYLEYIRATDNGLDNQGWKDSWDAIRFKDGSIARPPIALCEVQGYAYAARIGMADVFEALGERDRAQRLRTQAAALRQRFNRDFWLPEREYYALALDAEKRPVDALTSNPGHLLWTGIADEAKAALVARRLLSPEMYSGWGIRTMATTAAGYNPISYHNGSVWPHDNSLIVTGLARYGFLPEAMTVTTGLLDALARYNDHRLPELFAGYGPLDAPRPVEYPTANRPQAWASGSVFLLLTNMLGLDTTTWHLDGTPYLPAGMDRLRLDGLALGGQTLSVALERTSDGTVTRTIGAAADTVATGFEPLLLSDGATGNVA